MNFEAVDERICSLEWEESFITLQQFWYLNLRKDKPVMESFYSNLNQVYQRIPTHDTKITVQGDTKKWELLKNPTKIEEIQEKKFNDWNWKITTCLLRDSNPSCQCLKITSCRWRPPPHMHSFTATTHFKSSRSFVSPCVCVACSAGCDSEVYYG